jgi:hypothetical protein
MRGCAQAGEEFEVGLLPLGATCRFYQCSVPGRRFAINSSCLFLPTSIAGLASAVESFRQQAPSKLDCGQAQAAEWVHIAVVACRNKGATVANQWEVL